jgi:myo-inositol-1(or 4)-monophosphatase
MMNEEDVQFWSNVAKKIIEEAQMAISPLVGTTKGGEIVKMGADGTPTKLIDLVAENKVVEVLEDTGRSVTLISEEIGEFKIGEGSSEVVFVVDPLDGTSNALKNIPAYAISIAIADASGIHKTHKNLENPSGSQNINSKTSQNQPQNQLTIEDIEIGFVKNLATGDLYEAVKGQGAMLNGKELVPSTQEDISKSSIGAYIYRAEMNKVDKLCKAVRRMRILGSVAIELCYVADGTYDAFIDIRGNLRIVDISAAKLIIEETRGIVTDEKCQPLNGKLNVLERTSIIAACNSIIHSDIIQILGGI